MTNFRQLIDGPEFGDLDRHFAAFIEAQAGGNRPLLALAAALASRARGEGNICLDLAGLAGTAFPETPSDGVKPQKLPPLTAWLKELKASPCVGAPGEFCPLVLDTGQRLYLHRYWQYEQSLAAEILRRAKAAPEKLAEPLLAKTIKSLFPQETGDSGNLQAVAALAAARKEICVISGGPGTGKTHTLVLTLELLLELDPARKLRIAVAAPTGKAAARIQESIRKIKAALECGDDIKARLPENATTIHRLLGYVPDSAAFRHNAENPLPFDVVAVDEASMVDLALMAKLFQAVPPAAKIILLGDKDQLASVEAGAVLGDICTAAGEKKSALAPCVVQLKKNYRFGENSAIFHLSNAINDGDADAVSKILRDANGKSNSDLATTVLPERAKLKAALKEKMLAGFGEFLRTAEPAAALAALGRFRVLCALRDGPFGVTGLNRLVEEILAEAKLIQLGGEFYEHQPVMITRNDYHLKLFNGDIGVILPDGQGELRAYFPGADNELRAFLPVRLPPHETAFAMTVHKSQGSEFDRVLLVLPDKLSPILTRELLYTGITRARKMVNLWFDEKVFRAALNRRVRRSSGLCAVFA